MDFITVILIGLAIYSFIEKAKRKKQPERPMPGKPMPGRPRSLGETLSGGNSQPTTLMDMINQWVENQNPQRVAESKQKQIPQRDFFDLDEDPDYRPEELTQSSRYSGSLGGVSTQGEQGVEGLQGVEGRQGVEGLPGVEGLSGVEGSSGTRYIDETAQLEGSRSPKASLNLDLRLTERELMQGIVWAEVLGRPRALRPYRSIRS